MEQNVLLVQRSDVLGGIVEPIGFGASQQRFKNFFAQDNVGAESAKLPGLALIATVPRHSLGQFLASAKNQAPPQAPSPKRQIPNPD
jgi:hypothetical protein